VVPDPVNPWLKDLPGQKSARRELGIPIDDPTLLYFGEMRFEKGVDLLCDALESYDGPGFTMVLAGSPTDIDKRKLTNLHNPRITFDIRAEFVPKQDIPTLFSASDGVVFPYRRSFGKYRPSGVFQKACAAHRPVLAPDFGFFANRISKYDIGATFSAGDVHSLTKEINDFVETAAKTQNADQFESYVSTQTYQNLAAVTIDSYE
jgi:glycosyltransferase involved in cell wall biosynthesis